MSRSRFAQILVPLVLLLSTLPLTMADQNQCQTRQDAPANQAIVLQQEVAAAIAAGPDLSSCQGFAQSMGAWDHAVKRNGGYPCLDQSSVPDAQAQAQFLLLINEFRKCGDLGTGAGANAPVLQDLAALDQSSSEYSQYLAQVYHACAEDHSACPGLSHSMADPAGSSPVARMIRAGYKGNAFGENLQAGCGSAWDSFNSLRTACDPDQNGRCTYAHKKNMLDPIFNRIGIGRAYDAGSEYSYYWTTDFGTQ